VTHMARPKNIGKEYPLDLFYVVEYYFGNRYDFYDYRSNLVNNKYHKAHYTLGVHEAMPGNNFEALPALRGIQGTTYLESFDLWLRKYDIYRYIKTILPEAETYSLRSDVDRWVKQ
jgi:hypothetical protein